MPEAMLDSTRQQTQRAVKSSPSNSGRSTKAYWMGFASGICFLLTAQSIVSGYGILSTTASTENLLDRPGGADDHHSQHHSYKDGGSGEMRKKHVIGDFERQEGVVIVTKIHGPEHWYQYRQSMCLLKAAYNDRMNYDIVLFSTLPVDPADIMELQEMVAPANFSFVLDTQTLQEQLQDLTTKQQAILLERCNRTSLDQLSWDVFCTEEPFSHTAALQYLWQAEFRSKHLWTQPILQNYETMLWFDSDAMPMRRWEQDPIATFLQHDLVLLFDHFPAGRSRGYEFTKRIYKTYRQTLCGIGLKDGHLHPYFQEASRKCPPKYKGHVVAYNQIHGFFHITNLNFYRSEMGMKWANTLLGDSKFSRKFDDQIAVTVPAAVLAPEKAWDMRSHGLNFSVMHNGRLDGNQKSPFGWYRTYWENYAAVIFPQAWEMCQGLVVDAGR